MALSYKVDVYLRNFRVEKLKHLFIWILLLIRSYKHSTLAPNYPLQFFTWHLDPLHSPWFLVKMFTIVYIGGEITAVLNLSLGKHTYFWAICLTTLCSQLFLVSVTLLSSLFWLHLPYLWFLSQQQAKKLLLYHWFASI